MDRNRRFHSCVCRDRDVRRRCRQRGGPPASLPRRDRDRRSSRDIAGPEPPSRPSVRSETAAAAARKGQAESPWYPSMTLSTGYSRVRTVSPTTGQNMTAPNEFLRGDLSMLLTDFGRTSASVDRSDALLSASAERRRDRREDVAFAAKVALLQRSAGRAQPRCQKGERSGSASRSSSRPRRTSRPGSARRSTWRAPRRTCTTPAPR